MNRIDYLVDNWKIEKVIYEADWTITGWYRDCDPYGDVMWDFVELSEEQVERLPADIIETTELVTNVRIWRNWFTSSWYEDTFNIKFSINRNNFNFINWNKNEWK